MEDSFKVRVDKIFGSLDATSSSLWTLTDEEIERKEWNREKEADDKAELEKPFFSNGRKDQRKRDRNSLIKDLEDDDDDSDDREDETQLQRLEEYPGTSKSGVVSVKPDDYNDEEWDIKSSIGVDSTLDKEEEEDEFDKVAVGKENVMDGIYMTEVNDYGVYSDAFDELPVSIKDVQRDPRANHIAAKLRLKEDAEASGSLESLVAKDTNAEADNRLVLSDGGVNLKSILKKEKEGDTRKQKRVRFGSEISEGLHEDTAPRGENETSPMEESPVSGEASLVHPHVDLRVPDYLRNPSKYTHYTFDTQDDVDEKSNRQALVDFFDLVKKSKTLGSQPDDDRVELPKSVAFTPRKSTRNVTVNKGSVSENPDTAVEKDDLQRATKISIAAEHISSEVSDMEEDEPNSASDRGNNTRRPSRQYRSKPSPYMD